ncbi:hypothetical protein AB1Y20_015873 [Prymnesium parvum]|uniref:Pseudouridine synthase RsuA/RluA-like domain-containing protein n=1 Tax=Prymnesium parvum TaxID=97485 RepID=A0AB34JZQ7_PRYPA
MMAVLAMSCAAVAALTRGPLLFTRRGASRPGVTMAHASDALILCEESAWLVAAKPAGVTVHEGKQSLTAQLEAAAGRTKLFPVHRIDRETSGVVLIAKSAASAAELQRALQADETVKRYRGVLAGVPKARRGRWAASVSNRGEGRRNPRGASAERVDALTEYEVAADNGYLSCCEFTLKRGGRTHQIRKHAAIAGMAVVGDARYGDARRNEQLRARYGYAGMALHSWLLQIHLDGVEYTFQAPLPPSWEPLDLGWPAEAGI